MTIKNNWTIWGQPGCVYCNRAWDLLDSKGYETVQYNVIGQNVTKEQFLATNPGKRSVPQIYCDDVYVGDYEDLLEYLR